MSTNFQVVFEKKNRDLHVKTRGDFDGTSACRLIDLLRQKYDGKGKVIIDTQHLRKVYPFGCSTFQCRLNMSRVPAKQLVFEGEKGFDIAPRGSKVTAAIRQRRRHCNGSCAGCPCLQDKKT